MSQYSRTALALVLLALLAALPAVRADELCPTSPLDPAPVAGGIVNTYYPGTAPGQLTPGTTSVPVGAAVGAITPIATGDLLLIIQMQDATINSQNDDRYGDGVVGGNGNGVLDPREVGKFEYVIATGPVGSITPGEVPIRGEGPDLDGPGGFPAGLINTYTNAAATASSGQRRYQVIRVPRYATLNMPTVPGGITAGYWTGSTGGVVVLQVVGTLTVSATNRISATGRGFRGGMGQRLGGVAGASNVDFRYPSLPLFSISGAHGNKGEGIAGTPRYVRNSATGADVETGVEGYPDGSRARGAPGNAGGGGTDSAPGTNNSAAGGGGGGNGGTGGRGGNTSDNQPLGGHGGAAFRDPTTGDPLWGPGRLVMGGGAGSGTKNDGSPDESWGGPGGGIVMVHAGNFAGTGIIEANGIGSLTDGNDGGGGGGAGGSVLIVSKSTDFSTVTLTVTANGGRGADAGSGTSVLGPGGGGGGGVVLMTLVAGGTVTVTTTQGANGLTDGGGSAHGATTGVVGTLPPGDPSNPFVDPSTLVPGADSAADCEQNGAPINTVPGPQGTLLNTALVFSTANGNTVTTTDPDSDPDDVVATISVTTGTLTVDAADVAALTSVVGDGTATVVLTGTWAEINAALNPLTFTPPGAFSGAVTFQIVTDDQGNNGIGGTLTDTDTVAITVGNQNLPPVLTVPGAQATAEDVPLVFSSTGGNRISLTDPDSDPNPIQVTASVDNGTLTLADPATLTTVTGNGTASITMTGTLAALASALGLNGQATGITFTPPTDFVGTATITVAVDDLGWSLGGVQQPPPGLTDQGTITVDVTGVDDPPVAVNDVFFVANTDILTASGSGVLANDTDVEGQTLTAVLDAAPAAGTLVLNADGTFTYDPVDGFFGDVTFTYTAFDGTTQSNIATVTITVGRGSRRQRAGYCGLTGLEVFAALAALGMIRRFRRVR
ncbi:MAG TPA: Ig-like domain-containing protein [Planctomycetota bacterium]